MTDKINELLESVKARTDPELHSDLETITGQVDDLQTENEQLREEKESLQAELKKTSTGTIALASELEERYQELFENAIEGIYTTPESLDEYLLANPAFAALLGYESEKALCSAVDSIEEDVFVDSDRYAQYAETLHATEELNQFEYQVYTADGEIRWVTDSVKALRDEDGAVERYRGTVIDITEKKNQQRDLKRQTNLAIVLNRVLRHNLRNDISVIRGHTQLMHDKLDDDTNGEKVLNAIDGLLTLAEKARLLDEIVANDSEPELADIPALINGVVTQVRQEYPSATISVVSDEDDGEQITAKVLPNFKRAIQELVENAVKHSGDEPEVEVIIEANPDDVQIRIADNGPGIDEQEASVLESGSETPLSHGSGLGLWLTYWIVTSQGGVIDATVTEAGTTLSVLVPRTSAEGGQKQLAGLVRARDQYKSAFEEAGDGMTITDDEAHILDVNEEAARIFGVDKTALIGRPIREFIPGDFDFEAEWGEITADEMKRGEMDIVSADGGISPIEYTAKSHIVPGQHLIVSRDITERKEREQELQQVKEQLELAVEASGLGIYDWDMTTDKAEFTDQFVQMLGYSKAEFGDDLHAWKSACHPDDLERVEANLEAHIKGEASRFDHEARVQTADGDWKWVRGIGKIMDRDEDGNPLRATGTQFDISERKEREQEIRELKDRLELAVEGSNLGVWDWNITTGEVVLNEQYVEMLGYSKEEFGHNVDDWKTRIHPDDSKRMEAELDEHITGETEYFETEYRLQTADGDWKWLQSLGRVVDRDEDGNPLRALGTQLDISERKEREQELKLAETVFQASQDALVLVDVVDEQTFLIKRVNEAYEALSKHSSADVVGKTPPQAVGEAAGGEIESRYRKCVERRETIRFTQEVTYDGETRFWDTRLTPLIQDDEVTQLVAVAREITEHKEL